jgi:hypothetical protein
MQSFRQQLSPEASSSEQSTRTPAKITAALPSHRKKRTPEEYAKAVDAHASRRTATTLYPGTNYRSLALFLKQKCNGSEESDGFTFAILHNLAYDLHNTSRRSTFKTAAELAKFEPSTIQAKNGQILVLRGYPSPDWIKTIGAMYRIDPEVFRRYLSPPSSREFFDLPALPSSSDNIITLRVPSIGRCTATTLDRSKGKRAIERYWTQLGSGGKTGESIVRRYFWHNPEYFTIEQYITVTIKHQGTRWIGNASPRQV